MGFTKTPGFNTILPQTVRPCFLKFTYIWLNNGSQFWCKPVKISSNLVGCWVWNGSRYIYSEISLDSLIRLMCF